MHIQLLGELNPLFNLKGAGAAEDWPSPWNLWLSSHWSSCSSQTCLFSWARMLHADFGFLENDVASTADRMRKFRQASSHSPGESESWVGQGRVCIAAWARRQLCLRNVWAIWSQPSCVWTLEALFWHCGPLAWQPWGVISQGGPDF